MKYIIGRFTIQPKNHPKGADKHREYKGVEIVEGILWKAGYCLSIFESRFSNQLKINFDYCKISPANDRIKVTTSNLNIFKDLLC